MRRLMSAISLIALLLVVTGLSFAQDTITGRPTTTLNVRSGAGTEYDILTVIYPRNRVTIIGRNDFATFLACPEEGLPANEWLLVDVQGIRGWVVRCGMTISGELENLPVLPPDTIVVSQEFVPNEEDEDNEPSPYPTYIGIRAPAWGDSEYPIGRVRTVANVRIEPSLDAPILMDIAGNSQFFVVEESADGGWYRIEWSTFTRRLGQQTHTGWVARHLVTITRWV
jgi:uncharacterized protein YraI